jgi:HK97 family phage portal protein
MLWWERLKAEVRSLWNPNSPASLGLSGFPSVSGEPVSPERAIALTAVWGCVSLIAGSIASMPLVLYKRDGDNREKFESHPLFDVLRLRPNPAQSVTAFWEALVISLLLRGNSYALISRDDANSIRALWYVRPDRVSVDVLKSGKPRYRVSTPAGTQQTIAAEDMLHVVGPMSDDGYTGRSVIATFRETLGLGLALERYGSEFFANAATPRGVLTTASRLTDPARAHLTQSLSERHTTPGSRHKTLILEEGLKFEPIALSHEDSQFIESRRFSTEEIARIFGVPPNMIGGDIRGSMTYTSTELESLRLLKHTIGPWLARIESAVNFACISPLERRQMYVEFLPDALLSTTTKDRYDAYKVGLDAKFLTVDEVRRKENLPSLPAPVV